MVLEALNLWVLLPDS